MQQRPPTGDINRQRNCRSKNTGTKQTRKRYTPYRFAEQGRDLDFCFVNKKAECAFFDKKIIFNYNVASLKFVPGRQNALLLCRTQ